MKGLILKWRNKNRYNILGFLLDYIGLVETLQKHYYGHIMDFYMGITLGVDTDLKVISLVTAAFCAHSFIHSFIHSCESITC